MINRLHSLQRRALLPFILALTLLAGCSSASETASLTLNREGGDFEVSIDGKMVDAGGRQQIELAQGAPIRQPVTKFGGQPVWLGTPEWPLSRSTGRPMRFIGQFVLGDAGLGQQADRIAYLFMTDSEVYGSESPVVDGQYDPSMGENAVIIQPGSARQHETASMSTGPTLVARSRGWYQPALTQPVEYSVTLTEDIDPAYRSYASLPRPSGYAARMPIQAPDSAQWPVPPPTPVVDTEALDWSAHFEAIGGNKLGGTLPPLDPKHLPFSPERASLVLQLDMGEVPFFVDFGDAGVGHLFFDADTDKGWFMWSSG